MKGENTRLQSENEVPRADNSEFRANIRSLQIENHNLHNQVSNLTAGLVGVLLAIPTVADLVVRLIYSLDHKQSVLRQEP